MGKKSTAGIERMAAGIERLAEIFGRDRDPSLDDVLRANNALKEMIDKRDQQLAELRAELAEVSAYAKRLERDREQGGSGIVIVP